jgi:molecular chaperone GrpE
MKKTTAKKSQEDADAEAKAESAQTQDVSDPEKNVDDCESLQAQLRVAQDKYLRTLAEVENTKKRLLREKEEFVKYASESIMRSLLPILDSLDQALAKTNDKQNIEAVKQGFQLIRQQLIALLDKEGVQRIETVGQTFDPHIHEAIAQQDVDSGIPDNTILEEMQVGYLMHGKVVRSALVKVARHAAPEQQETSTNDS